MRKTGWNLFRLFTAAALFADLLIVDSLAQSYPAKPIRIVVGFAPGSGGDFAARLVAQKLSQHLSQPVVVENRAGAGGSIAAERVAKAVADGYTLLLMTGADTAQPALRRQLAYDLERDFMPVSLMAIGTLVLVVHPSVPARNVKELIALARSQPGKLSYASSGVGSTAHVSGELLKSMADVKIVHVPYKGSADAVIATVSGQVDMSFPSITAALPLLKVAKLRPLAVPSVKRTPLMPTTPTLHESGLRGYDRYTWYGLSAPAGVPKDIISQLNAAIDKVVNTPEMYETFTKQGYEPRTNTPDQFAALIHSEIAQNAKLISSTGARAE